MTLVGVLDSFWEENFAGVVPIPYTLRDQLPARWVRFHHLPESKRYPDTEAEMRTVLERHDMVMEHLFAPEPLVVVAGLFLDEADTAFSDSNLNSIAGPFEFWRSARWPDEVAPDDEPSMSLFVGKCDYDHGRDAILRLVANDEAANVIYLQPPVPVLYHPYDGGMDVIAEHEQFRDFLRATFPGWLSKHHTGL